jgi:vancomycin resistance protein YoaR
VSSKFDRRCAIVAAVPRLARGGLVALALFLTIVGAIAAGYITDSHRHRGHVLRNVTLTGTGISGLTPAQLAPIVRSRAAAFDATKITVDASQGGFTTTAKELGVRLDPAATTAAAMAVGRTGSALQRVLFWAKSWILQTPAPVRVAMDGGKVRAAVLRLDKGTRVEPVEPTVAYKKGAFTAVAGKPGKGIDPAEVSRGLPAAVDSGDAVTVHVARGSVAPRFSEADAKRLAGQAQATVTRGLALAAGSATATIPLATLRTWVTAKPSNAGLVLGLEADKVIDGVEKLLAGAGEPPKETEFTVEGGAVSIVPGSDGTACCGSGAAALVEQAMLRRTTDPVVLPLRPQPPKLTLGAAEKLGVKEVVGSFTTKHAAGQPRVTNIHRIADIVRGHVILPGESFSVNTFVGPRTTAKGFVVDHVIEDGRFAEAVGGGISQFATTTFNAAFFAGLDYGEYQAHSIYISRYPYGREGTLSYPHPDLILKNTTPYGVLIWPTYTATTITVTLYSTHYVDGAQTGQVKEPRGQCTRVTTERTRTYVADGRKEVDKVFALYQPAEGIDCAGNPTPTTSTTSTSTTSTTAAPGGPGAAPTTTTPTTAKP